MEPRGILAPPLIHGAPRLAVFHNHPNGSTTPSEPDRLTTERIVRCCAVLGLTLEDHLIIGRDDWGSMALHALRRKVQRNDGGIRGYLSWDEFWRVRDGRSNVQPKFRHPETGETWAGRGSMAGWLRRELEAGRDIEEFRVMKAE